MKRIAVIGAGMGGLSAVRVLKEKGHHVTVLDKSRGSGGRMATKKVGDASWDMGVQYITGHDPDFVAELSRWKDKGWVDEWQGKIVHNDKGSISDAKTQTRYVGVSRMTALSRALLEEADEFHPSVRIVDNERLSQGWMLNSECDQEFGPFDAVILNMPPKQALPLVDESPWIGTHIDALDMKPCWTLLLAFNSSLGIDYDGAFVENSPIAWVAKNNSKPGRDSMETWVVQASDQWSYKVEDETKEFVQATLLKEFFAVTGTNPIETQELWLHRWLYAFPEKPLADGALVDAPIHLAVCGDWCKSGCVEGAWLSGRQAALALAESF